MSRLVDNCVASGYLLLLKKGWKKKFVRLFKDGKLWFFRDEKSTKPSDKNPVWVKGTKFWTENVHSKKSFCLKIERFPDGVILECQNEGNLMKWARDLNRVGGLRCKSEVHVSDEKEIFLPVTKWKFQRVNTWFGCTYFSDGRSLEYLRNYRGLGSTTGKKLISLDDSFFLPPREEEEEEEDEGEEESEEESEVSRSSNNSGLRKEDIPEIIAHLNNLRRRRVFDFGESVVLRKIYNMIEHLPPENTRKYDYHFLSRALSNPDVMIETYLNLMFYEEDMNKLLTGKKPPMKKWKENQTNLRYFEAIKRGDQMNVPLIVILFEDLDFSGPENSVPTIFSPTLSKKVPKIKSLYRYGDDSEESSEEETQKKRKEETFSGFVKPALLFGSWLITWDDYGLAIPRRILSNNPLYLLGIDLFEKAARGVKLTSFTYTEITRKLAKVLCSWNRTVININQKDKDLSEILLDLLPDFTKKYYFQNLKSKSGTTGWLFQSTCDNEISEKTLFDSYGSASVPGEKSYSTNDSLDLITEIYSLFPVEYDENNKNEKKGKDNNNNNKKKKKKKKKKKQKPPKKSKRGKGNLPLLSIPPPPDTMNYYREMMDYTLLGIDEQSFPCEFRLEFNPRNVDSLFLADYEISTTEDSIFFTSHSQFDRFVQKLRKKNREKFGFMNIDFPYVFGLLVTYDRFFWVKHLQDPKNKQFLPLGYKKVKKSVIEQHQQQKEKPIKSIPLYRHKCLLNKNDFRYRQFSAIKEQLGLVDFSCRINWSKREEVEPLIKKDGINLSFIQSSELKNNKDLVKIAVRQNARSLKYTTKKFKLKNPEIIRLAVDQDGMTLRFVPVEFYTTSTSEKKVMKVLETAVRQNGLSLQYMPEKYRGLEKLVRLAVIQNGLSLQYASQEIREAQEEICLLACRSTPHAYHFITDSSRLKRQRQVILEVIRNDHRFLVDHVMKFCDPKLVREDEEICKIFFTGVICSSSSSKDDVSSSSSGSNNNNNVEIFSSLIYDDFKNNSNNTIDNNRKKRRRRRKMMKSSSEVRLDKFIQKIHEAQKNGNLMIKKRISNSDHEIFYFGYCNNKKQPHNFGIEITRISNTKKLKLYKSSMISSSSNSSPTSTSTTTTTVDDKMIKNFILVHEDDEQQKEIEVIYEKTFIGHYKNGKRNGPGKEYFEHVQIFEGLFRSGKRHGRGEYFDKKTRIIQKGEWKNGKLSTFEDNNNNSGYNFSFPIISFSDLEKHLRRNNRIGVGGFGSVFKVPSSVFSSSLKFLDVQKESHVAVKIMNTKDRLQDELLFRMMKRGIGLICSIPDRENILEIYGIIRGPRTVGYVMKLCQKSISDYIEELQNNSSDEDDDILEEKIRILYETSRGMRSLHSNLAMHRDLKWANVMMSLDDERTIKITDFDTLKEDEHEWRVIQSMQQQSTGIGTMGFLAPEVFNGNKYTLKCDVYAFGLMIYSLLWGVNVPYKTQYACHNCNITLKRIFNSKNLDFHVANCNLRPLLDPKEVEKYPDYLIELMTRCWDQNPFNRPSFEDICLIFEEAVQESIKKKKLMEIILKFPKLKDKVGQQKMLLSYPYKYSKIIEWIEKKFGVFFMSDDDNDDETSEEEEETEGEEKEEEEEERVKVKTLIHPVAGTVGNDEDLMRILERLEQGSVDHVFEVEFSYPVEVKLFRSLNILHERSASPSPVIAKRKRKEEKLEKKLEEKEKEIEMLRALLAKQQKQNLKE